MWLGHENTELDCLADENWEWLKLELSLPIEGWIVKRLSRRDDPHISSITRFVRHKSKGCFTYKFQLRPQSAEGFEKHYRLQQIAFDTFPHSAEFTSPSPVFVDAERQISLMSFVEGQPVSEVMKQSRAPDEQFELLAKCGAWLDAFHRSQGHEIRKFRPEHTLNYYQKLREQIELGDCDVTARSLFLRGIDKLVEVAPHVAGFETVAAMQHGDFHLRNLILNNGQIAGIDFSKDHVAPVGYDIAKILLDFTTLTRSSDGLATGQIVHHDTYEAFFNGYRLVGPDDPGVRLLLYARILATLNTVPAKQKERTYAKQRTLERLRPIASNAFRRSDAIPTQASEKMIKFLLTKKSLNVARQGDHEFAMLSKRLSSRWVTK